MAISRRRVIILRVARGGREERTMKRGNEPGGRRAAVCVEPLEGRALRSADGIAALVAVSRMKADAANANALAGAAEQQSQLHAPRGWGVSRLSVTADGGFVP